MKLKSLLAACCVVLAATATTAQSPGVTADPISGSWKGSVRPDDQPPGTRHQLFLTLKFDGTTSVSGTAGPALASQNGVIKSGQFDVKTGALKLDVEIADGGNTGRAVFDGRLFEGTAIGRFTLNERSGTFLLKKDGAPESAAAEGAAAPLPLGAGFDEVNGWVMKAAEMVPADKYTYRPVATVRTFGQQIAHIADAYNYYCAMAVGRKTEWSDALEKGPTDKATVTARLKEAASGCAAAYASSQAPPLVMAIAHTNLHYGNIITYLRMLGLVPPSSQS